MNTRVGLSFRPRACMRCGGDAYLSRGDDIEWRCLQCGRLVPDAQALVEIAGLPVAVADERAARVPARAA